MKNSRDIQIYLILSSILPEKEITLKILNIVKRTEKKENLDYHYERWETIAGSFFQSIERSPNGDPQPYSFVLDGVKYIYEKDRNMCYFNETGVSYQCRELLLETIKDEVLTCPESMQNNNLSIDNLTGEAKEWREKNDKMYGVLSQLIRDCMNLISKKNVYISLPFSP